MNSHNCRKSIPAVALAFIIVVAFFSSVGHAQDKERMRRGRILNSNDAPPAAEDIIPGLRTLSSHDPLELFFDFDIDYFEGWVGSPPDLWDIQNGRLRVVDNGFGDIRYAYYQDDFSNASIQTDLRQVQGATADFAPAFGLIARSNAAVNEFYEFDIAIDGYYTIAKFENEGGANFVDWKFRETPIVDWTFSGAINVGEGQWNTLKVDCSGNVFQFYINGVLVETVADSDYSTGKVGLAAWPGDDENNPVVVEYDNVSIVSNDHNSAPYRYYLPYFLHDSGNATGLALKNMNSSLSANVNFVVFDENGRELLSHDISLTPGGQYVDVVGRNLDNEGWILVESDRKLAGLCFVTALANPAYMMDIMLISQLAATLHVPHVAQDQVWDTTLFVCNPNDENISVTIKYVDTDGNTTHSARFGIDAHGSMQLALSDLLEGSEVSDGSVEITSTGGIAGFSLFTDLKFGNYNYAGIAAMTP